MSDFRVQRVLQPRGNCLLRIPMYPSLKLGEMPRYTDDRQRIPQTDSENQCFVRRLRVVPTRIMAGTGTVYTAYSKHDIIDGVQHDVMQ